MKTAQKFLDPSPDNTNKTLDLINALDTAYKDMDFSPLIKLLAPEIRFCVDCENFYGDRDGRPYKYEPELWLCDDCHDDRMEDE